MNYLQMLSVLGVGGAHPGGILLTKAIFEQEQFPLDYKILDAGCGTGQSTSYLYQLGYNITGLDCDPLMIDHSKKRNTVLGIDVPYTLKELSNTLEASNSYDIILCESVLNFTSLQETLPELKRILKPNGIVIAIEMVRVKPLSNEEINELTNFYGCPSIYSIQEWKEQFLKYGFHIDKVLSQQQYSSSNNEEPTTEFLLSDSIPDEAFNLLSTHEQLTLKYLNKLSYRIFFARIKN